MALSSGTKLGSYEIQSPLRVEGMGEVYRARAQHMIDGLRKAGLEIADNLPSGAI
jgi:hypothetical protein